MEKISRISFYRYVMRRKLKKYVSFVREAILVTRLAQFIARRVASRSSKYRNLVAQALFAYPEKNMEIIVSYLTRCFLDSKTSEKDRDRIIFRICAINRISEARELYERISRHIPDKNVSSNAMIEYAKRRDGEEDLKKAYEMAMEGILNRLSMQKIYSIFPEKKVPLDGVLTALKTASSVAVLCMRGPADESYFAVAFKYLSEDDRFDISKITILCDERMIGIYRRSFPKLNFFPIKKKKNMSFGDYSIFKDLPDIRLHDELCGRSFGFLSRQERVIHQSHLFYLYRDKLCRKAHGPYLLADPRRKKEIESVFPEGGVYAGVMWTGTVNRIMKRIFYYEIEHFERIFEIEGIKFVILNENISVKERRVLSKYGEKFIIARDHFDLYNDFEALGAIYGHLDFVVGAGSFNAMFAAPFGCRTYLLLTCVLSNAFIMPDGSFMSLSCAKAITNADGSYDRHATVEKAIVEIREYLAAQGRTKKCLPDPS